MIVVPKRHRALLIRIVAQTRCISLTSLPVKRSPRFQIPITVKHDLCTVQMRNYSCLQKTRFSAIKGIVNWQEMANKKFVVPTHIQGITIPHAYSWTEPGSTVAPYPYRFEITMRLLIALTNGHHQMLS